VTPTQVDPDVAGAMGRPSRHARIRTASKVSARAPEKTYFPRDLLED
jgi:hypothetical protein